MSTSNPPCASWIELAQGLRGRDRNGREHVVTRIEIKARSFIPDVYVRLDRDVSDLALYDDDVFITFVINALKSLGYVGRSFDRAELGMQGMDYIVLEPCREFYDFVAKQYRWFNLESGPTAY